MKPIFELAGRSLFCIMVLVVIATLRGAPHGMEPGSGSAAYEVASVQRETFLGAPLSGSPRYDGSHAGSGPPNLPDPSPSGVVGLYVTLPSRAGSSRGGVLDSETATPSPAPTSGIGTALLGGYATYYTDPKQTIPRYAAAGPQLRSWLGHWRNRVIVVHSGQHQTVVRLVDSCQCGDRQGLSTLIDLSPASFADLAPLSAGVIQVSIELVSLPPTDSEAP